jgi:HTH-type transcriptional regulator/antitoxin HipB
MRVRSSIDFGLVIRERRRDLGLSQGELAARVGVSRQWIVGMEKGKPRAEVDLLLRTLNALGLELNVEAEGARRRESFPEIPDIDIDAVIDRARGVKS